MSAMSPASAVIKLIALGMSETKIAKAVGVAQSTISRIKTEVSVPSYTTAVALIELAKRKGKEA
jgi:DNA-binding XRE family transcriptional regulator